MSYFCKLDALRRTECRKLRAITAPTLYVPSHGDFYRYNNPI